MKNRRVHSLIFMVIVLQLLSSISRAQICENKAINFDGIDDYITLNLPSSFSNSSFTAEVWCNAAPSSSNSAIMTLHDLSNTSAVFLGINPAGALFVFWQPTTGTGGISTLTTNPADVTGSCHHFALQQANGIIYVWMDGVQIFNSGAPPAGNGPYNFQQFDVGDLNGVSPFVGQMDEVRLWNNIRSSQEINEFKDCSLSGGSGGLNALGMVVNWSFDQPGININGSNSGQVAVDTSGSGNDGTFINFTLSGTVSNFVCNTCPSPYYLSISDQVSSFPNGLSSICSGDPMHFCVMDYLGNPILIPSGNVIWQSSDNNGPFQTDADLVNYTTTFSQFQNSLCLPIKKNTVTAPDCSQVGQGYTDRRYRAKIEKNLVVSGHTITCTYLTSDVNIQICCPPTGGSITITPNITPPWCEGDNVSMAVMLNPADPWIQFGPLVTIDWCIVDPNTGGIITQLPQGHNQFAFNLSTIIGIDDFCLQAKISNCICPPITITQCFGVDPLPVCGIISLASPISPLVSQVGPDKYTICPNNTTVLTMINPASFMNSISVWQYSFSSSGPWFDLASGNSIQNTNYLPSTNPPAPWPSGTTCIYYRIECRPLSYPNSGCDPDHSNDIEICLNPQPPFGTISGNQQFCEGGNTTLTITPNTTPLPPAGGWNYVWYLNGVYYANGNSITTNKPGCYWVEIGDVCGSKKIGPYCVEACLLVPVIKCPEDNPCACDDLPITLNGCDSYSTCGNPVSYSWTASNNGPCQPGANGPCECVHTPDPINGTDYTLTITDLILGCTITSKVFHIQPCQ